MNILEEIKKLIDLTPADKFETELPEIKKGLKKIKIHKIKDLIDKKIDIPNEPGVYFACRDSEKHDLTICSAEELEFEIVKGGWYDKRSSVLERKLNECETILYIGKAENLQERIPAYMKFVKDMKTNKKSSTPHRGGRAICLLKEVFDLDFCWISLKDLGLDPEDFEKQLIQNYKAVHGLYPFANWRA